MGDVVPNRPIQRPGAAGARGGIVFTVAILVLAFGWLVSRIFAGIDFTDEMQHYAEIEALTRTSRFFEVDFFIQQLGYILLLPLFKLHAAIFPDQSYLVVFGRVVLLAAYAGVGLGFWRAAKRHTESSIELRIAATALCLAWIPFQLFSPNYNTLSYLLIVALLAVRPRDDRIPSPQVAAAIGMLLAALAASYPPAGLALAALFIIDAARRNGRYAWRLAGLMLASGALLGCAMLGLHGRTLPADLMVAIRFSNAFALRAILEPDQLASLLVLVFVGWLCIRRVNRRAAWQTPFHAGRPALVLAIALAGLGGVIALLLWLADRWLPRLQYFPAAVGALLLMLLAGNVAPADGQRAGPWIRLAPRAVLVAGCAALLFCGIRWSTGYFATAVWVTLLIAAAMGVKPGSERAVIEIVGTGTVLGATYAITSGNGLHNFGVGAMAAAPFLALRVSAVAETAKVARPISAGALLASILALLHLVAGAGHPYREERAWWTLRPIAGIPAFKGIWTCPTKLEALRAVGQLVPPGGLTGQRLLVAGPQPWMYFATGGEPATPMAFMHFSGGPAVDRFLAAEFFRHGEPDAILVPNALPLPLHPPLAAWMAKGFTAQKVTLPPGFVPRYRWLTRYDIADQLLLLRRKP